MSLAIIDWVIIVSFLLLFLYIGLRLKSRSEGSISDFFLSGRRFPWYIAGISMVATTFAADTPLAVTELVSLNGISGNWLWWNMLIGGMLTTFFFANLWRRAEILTELELIEIRYSGRAATFLRGFKSVYMGLFINALIIGWVNIALMSLLKVFFNIPDEYLIWVVAAIMLITVTYSALSGLWGVAITDVIQFTIAMTGCIILAIIVISSDKIGGISGLKQQLPEGALNFFPVISSGQSGVGFAQTLSISIGAFLAFIGVQWWASWYPGAEPGGGGYIAQRMMSCKNEKHSVFATLFFQIAHYCIRPWPWILVALAAMVLYPELSVADKKLGYVMAMKEFLPAGFKGLLLLAFLSAYMSTISTQMNWGASFLLNDFYKRFIRPENSFKNEKKAQKNYVAVARIATVFIMVVSLYATTKITRISAVWEFLIECGAGLGLVLILRWYWWRINAWSELVATIFPFFAYGFAKLYLEKVIPESYIQNKFSFFFTVGTTTIAWITATFLTKPTSKEILSAFYKRVRPEGAWKPFRGSEIKQDTSNFIYLSICWLSSIVMVYSTLFLSGMIIFAEWQKAALWFVVFIISFITLRFFIKKTNLLT
ncbi:MAG: Na+:solute symporter [Bacteroidales bacterium]|nr:Na+:solute symporter [Bacteroidales bacterium]